MNEGILENGEKKWKHPEIEEGEILLGNFDEEGFKSVGWETRREGQIAYDTVEHKPLGNSWKGSFPVFIERSEIEAKIANLDEKKDLEKIKVLNKLLEQ